MDTFRRLHFSRLKLIVVLLSHVFFLSFSNLIVEQWLNRHSTAQHKLSYSLESVRSPTVIDISLRARVCALFDWRVWVFDKSVWWRCCCCCIKAELNQHHNTNTIARVAATFHHITFLLAIRLIYRVALQNTHSVHMNLSGVLDGTLPALYRQTPARGSRWNFIRYVEMWRCAWNSFCSGRAPTCSLYVANKHWFEDQFRIEPKHGNASQRM